VTRQRDATCIASPPPTPWSYLGRRHCLQPLCPCPRGWGAMAGLALGATPTGWGPPAGASEIWIPRRGSQAPVWRTATPLSSRVDNVARIAVLGHGSSQSAVMFWGSIRDLGAKVSPVIPPPPGVPACPRTDQYPARAGSYRCCSGR
jgi:hypothetical protein